MLLSSIDIGSNSTILLIASKETDTCGKIRIVPKIQKVEICRLGEDIFESGAISDEKLALLSRILEKFRSDVHALGAEINAAIMTEAMRRAKNAEAVTLAVERALWIRPRVISGIEEGTLTYRAVTEWHGEGITTIDIGGGSTEFSNGKDTVSIPVGALFLFKKWGAIPGPEYKGFIKEILKENPLKSYAKRPVYLVGGTATALAMVFLNMQKFDYAQIEGLEITMADLETVIMRISNLSKELRAALPGLGGGRSDVIICGLYWLRSVLERLHAESFRISTAGIRFGVLYPPKEEVEQKIKRIRHVTG